MADMLDISPQAVYKYFRGSCLPVNNVFKIAQILGVTMDDILIGEETAA